MYERIYFGISMVHKFEIKQVVKFKVVLIFILILFLSFVQCDSESSQSPNILVIVSDDQGYGDFSAFGNEILKTPNLDAMHQESITLTNFYTTPVCSPTRAALFTGRYSYRTGVWDTWKGRNYMRADEITVAEILKENGYYTGFFGKWHLGYNYPFRPMDQGFEEAFEWEIFAKDSAGRVDPIMKMNGNRVQTEGFTTDVVFSQVMEFLERKASSEVPFFAYVGTFLSHVWDYPQVPESYVNPYYEYSQLNEHTRQVYGMVSKVDENIGRIMQKIEELNFKDNTVVIYFSDNGPQFISEGRYNRNLRGSKTTVYEGGIKQPAFFRWPGNFEAGTKAEITAAHIDILPTILDIFNIQIHDNLKIDGRSLLPILTGKDEDWKQRTLMGQFDPGEKPDLWDNSYIRQGFYKLVNGNELYDLKADPSESQNIAETNADLVKRMRNSYKSWFKEVSSDRGFTTSPVILGVEDQKRYVFNYPHKREDGWPVKIVHDGPYDIKVPNFQSQLFPNGGSLNLEFGDKIFRQSIVENQNVIELKDIYLPEGEYFFNVSTSGKKISKQFRWGWEDLGWRTIEITFDS